MRQSGQMNRQLETPASEARGQDVRVCVVERARRPLHNLLCCALTLRCRRVKDRWLGFVQDAVLPNERTGKTRRHGKLGYMSKSAAAMSHGIEAGEGGRQ